MNQAQQENKLSGVPEKLSEDSIIPVAVVEDSATVRRNLERWLNRTPGCKCVCACANGIEALRMIPAHAPRIVLMDIQMPEMSGVECAVRLKTALPSLQIIMLTVYEDTDTIFKALRAGASGYLLKRSSHQEILGAIRDLLHGGAPMTAAIARKVVAAFHEPVKQEDPHTLLSGREREILDLLSAGLSNKEIGARLNVSQFTVKNHLANVFAKLHVRSRTQAVIAYLHPR
ncbi:MAG TPA: response regulator transcription factor [Candidatus Saccharimonadales bacterium]|nr:response regulator transcription factor [Candidatus Saccharimonadales bacterium]